MERSRKGQRSLFLFILMTAFLFWLFVYQQWYLVSSGALFVTLIFAFVVLSFFSSAIETAFSTAHTDKSIQVALDRETASIGERYNVYDEMVRAGTSISNLDKTQRRELAKIEKDDRRLRRKRASLEESSRSIYVGTFATLSTFLNVALAAALPYALVNSTVPVTPIGLDFVYWVSPTPTGLNWVWGHLDLSGQKVLVFFASSFPILVFGKVLPKEIGALFNYYFAYKLNFVARAFVRVVGFIPAAFRWPLDWLRAHVARRRSSQN